MKDVRYDIVSGFIVFLIALPLCLGISIASGFPPIAGIYTAILGGAIGVFSGSPLAVKGPAAGLIVIILGSVQELGQGDTGLGYRLTLGVIVMAGILQVFFGTLKMGAISKYFPLPVIRGMMASIGIIIIIKQIYPLVGLPNSPSSLFQSLIAYPTTFSDWKWEIAIIGIISLVFLIGFPYLKSPWIHKIPAPILVVAVGILLSVTFNLAHVGDGVFFAAYQSHLGEEYLVNIPSSFLDGIQFPDFSAVFTLVGLKYILLLSLIGSLESLMTVAAIDSMDPLKRKSDMDRDLLAIGLANTASGLIGGLPMISEVVRSSANIQNGGRTWIANFSHGIFLLVFVAFLPKLIHLIPLSALSGILIYTGFRLASPATIRKILREGWKEAVVFFITIVVTILQDLLMGICLGTIVYYFLIGRHKSQKID